LVLALALAGRGGRPLALAERIGELTFAFVVAHAIHYATVVARAVVEPTNRLRNLPLDGVAVVVGGVGLLVVLAATVRARSQFGARIHQIGFYLAWAILAAALASRAGTSTAWR
jgi:hypothetical protein